MVPFAGFSLPVQYEGIKAEHEAVRSAAGLFDVSHMGELMLEGDKAASVIDWLVTNDVKGLPVGKALYTVCCNSEGTILDDLIIYRRAETSFMVVCNASNREKISSHFATAARGSCEFRDQSDDYALLALQGPNAFDVLAAADAPAVVRELKPFHLCDASFAGAPVIVARTGYTGEDGVEIFCKNADAVQIWERLLKVGEPLGIKPCGLGARDTLRLEARLSLYGNEIDETTNPLEAGLGWTVKFGKENFVGREALAGIKAQGLQRKLVGFEMTGRGIARHGYPIVEGDGKPIGYVTSGCPSPTLGKNIGLGYVPVEKCEIGQTLHIEIRNKVIDAVVVKTPFYKRS